MTRSRVWFLLCVGKLTSCTKLDDERVSENILV
jgi:hypothetical protein